MKRSVWLTREDEGIQKCKNVWYALESGCTLQLCGKWTISSWSFNIYSCPDPPEYLFLKQNEISSICKSLLRVCNHCKSRTHWCRCTSATKMMGCVFHDHLLFLPQSWSRLYSPHCSPWLLTRSQLPSWYVIFLTPFPGQQITVQLPGSFQLSSGNQHHRLPPA